MHRHLKQIVVLSRRPNPELYENLKNGNWNVIFIVLIVTLIFALPYGR